MYAEAGLGSMNKKKHHEVTHQGADDALKFALAWCRSLKQDGGLVWLLIVAVRGLGYPDLVAVMIAYACVRCSKDETFW